MLPNHITFNMRRQNDDVFPSLLEERMRRHDYPFHPIRFSRFTTNVK